MNKFMFGAMSSYDEDSIKTACSILQEIPRGWWDDVLSNGSDNEDLLSADFQINAETRAEVLRLNFVHEKPVGVLEDSATLLSLSRENSFVLTDTRTPSNDPGNNLNQRANIEDCVQL
eukprot:9852521-Ditylum_brightwellii.AAC.1